jgi:hypothetical protein
MQLYRSGDWVIGLWITGPTHNLLGLNLDAGAEWTIQDVSDADQPTGIDPSSIGEQVQKAIRDHLEETGTSVVVSGVCFSSGDTPSTEVYYSMAREILASADRLGTLVEVRFPGPPADQEGGRERQPRIEPGTEAYRLLYCDEDGDGVGLDEVQLLDPIPSERLGPLRTMLVDSDPFVRFQATLVLAAWADPAGLTAAGNLIREQEIHQLGFSPHRLFATDTAYDQIADALYVGAGIAEPPELAIIRRLTLELLDTFEFHFFRSGLRLLTERIEGPEFAAVISSAVRRAVAEGQYLKASEQMAAIARRQPGTAWSLVYLFVENGAIRDNVQANICDALAYVETKESRSLLNEMLASDVPGVEQAARRALEAQLL